MIEPINSTLQVQRQSKWCQIFCVRDCIESTRFSLPVFAFTFIERSVFRIARSLHDCDVGCGSSAGFRISKRSWRETSAAKRLQRATGSRICQERQSHASRAIAPLFFTFPIAFDETTADFAGTHTWPCRDFKQPCSNWIAAKVAPRESRSKRATEWKARRTASPAETSFPTDSITDYTPSLSIIQTIVWETALIFVHYVQPILRSITTLYYKCSSCSTLFK